MRQESTFALLSGITVNTVELKAMGKKVQKRCMVDLYSTLSYKGSETGRHEKLGSTWTCCPLCAEPSNLA